MPADPRAPREASLPHKEKPPDDEGLSVNDGKQSKQRTHEKGHRCKIRLSFPSDRPPEKFRQRNLRIRFDSRQSDSDHFASSSALSSRSGYLEPAEISKS